MMRRQYQHRLPELKVMKNLLVQASVWIGQSPAVVSGNQSCRETTYCQRSCRGRCQGTKAGS